MLGWNFYINNTPIDEPIGWDGIEFKFQRSKNFYGLENTFTSTQLSFDGAAAKLISAEFALNGFDGTLDFKIEDICDTEKINTTIWQINLMFYSKVNNLVSVTVSETGFSQKFKNRLDLTVSLDSLTSVGGTALLPPAYKTIGLHSKALKREGKMDFEQLPASSVFHLNDFNDNPEYYFMPLFNRLVTDLDTFQLPTVDSFHAVSGDIAYFNGAPLFTSSNGGSYNFHVKIDSTIRTSNHSLTRLKFVVGTGVAVGQSRISDTLTSHAVTGDAEFILTYESNMNTDMFAGESLWIYFDTVFEGVLGDTNLDYSINYNISGNYLTFEDLNQFRSPSTAKAMLIHDVFARVCEMITDEIGCFKSEFFGLTDQFPFYDADGCGSHTAVTNGKNIRNMLQSDGSKFPMSMTFNDLFKSCEAVWNIGMRIEYNRQGKATIRVEPKSYFFREDSVALIMDYVSNITIAPATNYVFNAITIGYEQWNLSQGSINGIDEFNTVHNYSLPLQNANQSLSAKSSFIASGYIIELTRRIQYDSNPTTDFEVDDNNFFICLNPKDITSSRYSNDGSIKLYKANTVSEIKSSDNFPDIFNLLSPESAYNLRITPARNLLRWWDFISASIYYKIKQSNFTKISFQSGEGNVKMISTQAGDCKETINPLAEDQDIQLSTLDTPSTLFAPILYQFDYPLKFKDFDNIRKNSNLGIQINCDGVTAIVGFLEELTYKPAGPQNGIGNFTILLSAESGAAFSDGFNQGFNI